MLAVLAGASALASAAARQSGPPRPPAADAPERIDQAMGQAWGRLPERVEVKTDATGYPWFTVPDFDSFVQSDRHMQSAAAQQVTGRRLPAPGLVPFWSDGTRAWYRRESVPHLLRSYDSTAGRWQALHINGRIIDDPEALKAHLEEIERRAVPDFARTEGQWISAALGLDGTLHLLSQDDQGVRLRSGRVDPARGVEQVKQWPAVAAPPGLVVRSESDLVPLPGGEVWAFLWPELGEDWQSLKRVTAPSVWQYLPGREPAWRPLTALSVSLQGLADDPFSGSMGFLEVVPLPSGEAGRPASRAIALGTMGGSGNAWMVDVPQELDEAGVARANELIANLADPDFQVRQSATEALSAMPEAHAVVSARLAAEQDPERRIRLQAILAGLTDRRPGGNEFIVEGQRYRFEHAQVISTGATGVGAVVLLDGVRHLTADGRALGDSIAKMLLTIPYRAGEGPAGAINLLALPDEDDVQQPDSISKQYRLDPSPLAHWLKPDQIWMANGWRLDLKDDRWHPTSHIPEAVVELDLRTVDRDGRLYFGTTRFHHTEQPILVHWPDAPADDATDRALRQPQHPPQTEAFTPFPGITNFLPIPAEASAGPGRASLEGAWGIRHGPDDGGGRLVLLSDGRAEVTPAPDVKPRLRMSYLIPLRGGAIVYEGAPGRAALWDGTQWHLADDLAQLVHRHATAIAKLAGNDAAMPSRGLYASGAAILTADGRGGLWFMQSLPPGGERQEPVLHLGFFDGNVWHDLSKAFATAVTDGESTLWQKRNGPVSRYVIDDGKALVIQTPEPAAGFWHVSLDDAMTPKVRRMTPYGHSATVLVPDGRGRLWSHAFGTSGTPISAWAEGEALGVKSVPQPRTVVIREGNAEAFIPQGSEGLIDGAGRPWLFSFTSNAGKMEIVAHVRLLESEQDALHPASPRPPQRQPSRAGLDFFGGSWASTGLIGLDGDATGQRWTLDGEGRLWLLTETGLLRPEIRRPRYVPGQFTPQQWLHMRPGPQVEIAEHRPWPRPMTGARLAVPDRGGLWIEPLRNEFGQPQPTFYMPLAPSTD